MNNLHVAPAVPERTLEYVDPRDMFDVWTGIVKPVMVDHLAKYGSSWLVEDVYMELKLGKSQLFLGNSGADGFAIFSRTEDSKGGVFWVWFAYGPGMGSVYFDQIVGIAKGAGCNRLAFSSPLPFWEKHASTYGFEEKRKIYERVI